MPTDNVSGTEKARKTDHISRRLALSMPWRRPRVICHRNRKQISQSAVWAASRKIQNLNSGECTKWWVEPSRPERSHAPIIVTAIATAAPAITASRNVPAPARSVRASAHLAIVVAIDERVAQGWIVRDSACSHMSVSFARRRPAHIDRCHGDGVAPITLRRSRPGQAADVASSVR